MVDTGSKEQEQEIQNLMAHFGLTTPGPQAVFTQLQAAAAGNGALEKKAKEMLALGICIVGCRADGISEHIIAARQAGASREEILEAVGTAVLMGGPQSMEYGFRVEEELLQEAF